MQFSDDRLKRYGISRFQVDELYRLQNGLCGCCDTRLANDPDGVAVDHDHESGQVRGLLCRSCNTLLGRLGDSVEEAAKRFQQIVRYLTVRRQSVDASLTGNGGTGDALQILDYALRSLPTWTSRCAARLGFYLVLNGAKIPVCDVDGKYGLGVDAGYLVCAGHRAAGIASKQYNSSRRKALDAGVGSRTHVGLL